MPCGTLPCARPLSLPIRSVAQSSGPLLQGGKLSALAGAVDARVKAVCLLDPVDNTVYAPEGPDYPSAVAAIRHAQTPLAMAVIGCGRAGDCVPKAANYRCCWAADPLSHQADNEVPCYP
jgi:hypothetical protein